MASYDWVALKRKFITSPNKTTLKQFAIKNKLPYTLLRQNAKGWVQEWRTKNEQKTNNIINGTIQKQTEQEIDYNLRHLKVSNDLLNAIEICSSIEALTMISTRNGREVILKYPQISKIKDLTNSLEKIQHIQRLAKGLDNDNGGGKKDIVNNFIEAVKNNERANKEI